MIRELEYQGMRKECKEMARVNGEKQTAFICPEERTEKYALAFEPDRPHKFSRPIWTPYRKRRKRSCKGFWLMTGGE